MKASVAAALSFVFAGQAHALTIAPMTREQIACYANEDAILAHVVGARSYVCDKRGPDCFPNYVSVTAVVDEVIAPSRMAVRVGDAIRVSISVIQPARPEDSQQSGSIIIPGDRAEQITDDLAKSALVGRSFLFALASRHRSLHAGIPSHVDDPYYADAYPTGDEQWFRATWDSADCRNQREQADAVRQKLGIGGDR
jgi:hypothetical protein